MRLTLMLAAHVILLPLSGAVAQLAPAWMNGGRMKLLTTEIATTQLIVEMCKLDAKQLVDDGNTVFEFIKEFHAGSYTKGWEQARSDFAKAQQQQEATCELTAEKLPDTKAYFARLAEQVRPLLQK